MRSMSDDVTSIYRMWLAVLTVLSDPRLLQTDIPSCHFDFAMKYILLSDILCVPNPSRGPNTQRGSSADAKVESYFEMFHSVRDPMNNFGSMLLSGNVSAKFSEERKKIDTESTILHIPTDTKVYNRYSQKVGNKDLIAFSRHCPVGFTKLKAVKAQMWLNNLMEGDFLPGMPTQMSQLHMRERDKDIFKCVKLSFKCDWPISAVEWKTRTRQFSWPPEEVVIRITENSARVIPAEDPASGMKTDWKYTFEHAEQILSEEVLSTDQLDCFHIAKMMVDELLGDNKLTLTQLKHVFFYMCEETNTSAWTKESSVCLQQFLNRLYDCVKKRFIPSYFIPTLNILEERDEQTLATMTIKLETASQNTFVAMYFTFEHLILLYSTVNTLFDSIIEDSRRYIRNPDLSVSVRTCFLPLVAVGICSVLTLKKFEIALEKCRAAGLYFESVSIIPQGSLESILTTVVNNVPNKLNKWLFAFYVDQKMETMLVEYVCNNHPKESLFEYFGQPLKSHLKMTSTDVPVPLELVRESTLAETTMEIYYILLKDICLDHEVMRQALLYFVNRHLDRIVSYTKSSSDQRTVNYIKMIKTTVQINNMQAQIREENRRISMNAGEKWEDDEFY